MSNGSIYDLYEFYLEPRDLREKAHVVTVESVRVDNVINPRAHKPEKKIVLRFVNRRKSMILNKTQAGAMAEITGTDEYMKWKGAEVVLTEGRAGNGRQTIVITTKEESGDIDLMFPKQDGEAKKPTNVSNVIPATWWKSLETGGKAVKYAARVWNCDEPEAWGRIKRAVDTEAISAYNPPEQFMQWVQLGNLPKGGEE